MLSHTRALHIPRRSKLTTAAAGEPITLADAKAQLRVTTSAEDSFITALITVSRQALEKRLGMVFMLSTYTQSMDSVPGYFPRSAWDRIESGRKPCVPYPSQFELLLRPAVAITSITTYDDDDVATVVDEDIYRLDASDPMWPSRVSLKRGFWWPTDLRLTNAFEIAYTVGYADAAAVPGDIKQALLQLVAYLYDHRGSCECSTGGADSCMIPCGAALLVSNYTLPDIV